MLPGTIYIGADHAGFELKQTIFSYLEDQGWKVEDLGTQSTESVNYPEYADKVCESVLKTGHKGILICGTGIGMSIAANRHKGIRAAVCTHEFHAQASRAHNNANVLCLGSRITAPALAILLTELFMRTEFEGGRHECRVSMMDK